MKILRKKYEREIINYDTLKTSNAELLEEKIPKVFFAIYFCSYEREIINYDTLKTSNAELLEEKIPKVVFAIYFCSYERKNY